MGSGNSDISPNVPFKQRFVDVTLGRIEPEDANYEVIERDSDGEYFRFVFRDSRVMGSILLGDTALTGAVKKAIETKADFSDILRKRPGAADVIADLAERSG